MTKQNMPDERVAAQRHKIKSEAFGILMLVLIASIIVQQYFLDAPFEQYAAEIICFFGVFLYAIARYLTLGHDMFGNEKRAKVIPYVSSIAAGIVVTAINGVLNYAKYGERYKGDNSGAFIAVLVITFISATVLTFVGMSCMSYFNTRKQAQIQKQLDEAENGN